MKVPGKLRLQARLHPWQAPHVDHHATLAADEMVVPGVGRLVPRAPEDRGRPSSPGSYCGILGTRTVDGLVALPLDARNREQLEWLADEILEAGGDSSLWLAEATSPDQERDLAERMAAAVAEEYRGVIAAARHAHREELGQRRRTLARLRRELRRIRSRDYFPPAEAEEARRAIEALALARELAP